MRFNVNRMGEQYQDVTDGWLASITTMGEYRRILKLAIGERAVFERGFTGPVGYTRDLIVVRTS